MALNEKKTPPPGRFIPIGIVLFLGFLVAKESVVIVDNTAKEMGLVLRLGEFDRRLDDGLNFVIPYIEEAIVVAGTESQSTERGELSLLNSTDSNLSFTERLERLGIGDLTSGLGVSNDAMRILPGSKNQELVITGDRRLVSAKWTVLYFLNDDQCIPLDPEGEPRKNISSISSVYCYKFMIDDSRGALNALAESVVREVIGNYYLEELLGEANGPRLSTTMQEKLTKLLQSYKAGVTLEAFALEIRMPAQVIDYWLLATSAQEERRSLEEEGRRQLAQQKNRAEGEYARMLKEAQGYQTRTLLAAQGELQRIQMMYNPYKENPKAHGRLIYLRGVSEALQSAQNFKIIPEGSRPFIDLGISQTHEPLRGTASTARQRQAMTATERTQMKKTENNQKQRTPQNRERIARLRRTGN